MEDELQAVELGAGSIQRPSRLIQDCPWKAGDSQGGTRQEPRWAVLAAALAIASCTTFRQDSPDPPHSTGGSSSGGGATKQAGGLNLRMPIESGAVVFCSQGNEAPAGQTHAHAQNRYSLDLSARGAPSIVVVSAAAGRVGFSLANSGDDRDAGAGYGNQVKVQHTEELYSFYAHLDEVFVLPGQQVPQGHPLGTMGRTGMAGERHLHFGLQSGVGDTEEPSDSVAIESLTTALMDSDRGFESIRGVDLLCSSYQQPWSGEFYGSENDGAPRAFRHAARGPLANDLLDAYAMIGQSMACRQKAAEVAQQPGLRLPAATQQRLEPCLRQHPDDPVLRYFWATEVEIPRGQWHPAFESLNAVIAQASEPAYFEPWIIPWAHNYLGAIELHWRKREAALSHFSEARALSSSEKIVRFAQAQLRQADANAYGL